MPHDVTQSNTMHAIALSELKRKWRRVSVPVMYCVMHIYDIVSQYCPRFVQIRRHVPRKPEQLARTRVRIFEERVIGVSCLLSLQLLHILEGEVSLWWGRTELTRRAVI